MLPHLEGTITPGVNYVFCVTFQLAWKDLAKSTVNSAIQLEGGPSWIDVLNQGRHAPSGLSQDCYLSMGGFVRDGIVQRIRNKMAQRFPNAQLTVPEPPASTVAYVFAYLEKSLSFGEAFDRSDGTLRWPLGGNLTQVSSFGSADFCSGTRRYDAIVEQVTILDYANDDDFVLKLNSSSRRDEIILAKIQPQVTLRETIESVESRINKSSLDEYARKPQTGESLVVPIIRVDTLRIYDEITGKPFLNPPLEGLYIAESATGNPVSSRRVGCPFGIIWGNSGSIGSSRDTEAFSF